MFIYDYINMKKVTEACTAVISVSDTLGRGRCRWSEEEKGERETERGKKNNSNSKTRNIYSLT